MTRMRDTRHHAFTLVEILVVIAIISALIGLLSTGGTSARRQAKEFQARTMIASLESALAMYHVDFGEYPADSNAYLWINLLVDQATYGATPDWNGPYISFKTADLIGTIPNAQVKDPWDNGYHYARGTNPPYRIWSNGPDGVNNNGTGDDIRSW